MKKTGLLDKNTRTSIMIGAIICLSIAVLFCIIRIATRPDYVKEDTNFYLPQKTKADEEEIQVAIEKEREKVKIEVKDRARIIEDNVNIRSGPSTEYERVGSAYSGFDYEILSATETSGWIKIRYDDKPAYVFAEYVEIVPMFLNDMGEYEEYVEVNSSEATTTDTDSEGTDDADTDADDSEDTEE